MRLVRMNGGLGNQIFQYIFTRYIELKTGDECIIDDTELYNITDEIKDNPVYNGYQLERIFSIHHNRLSTSLDKDVFDELIKLAHHPTSTNQGNKGLVSVFKELGVELTVIQEGSTYITECKSKPEKSFSVPINEFTPDIIKYSGDLFYYGYWINAGWMAAIIATILKELTFPEIIDKNNLDYMSQIKSADVHSIALHVRRGDFVTLGWALDPELYKYMVTEIRKKISYPEFFVFSDDIPWVKDNAQEIGLLTSDKIVFIEGNFRDTSFVDMQLMKECRGMVFPNSSFSYLASLLNTRKDKVVIQPTNRYVIYYH